MLDRRAGLGRGLIALATTLSLTLGSLLALTSPAPVAAQSASFSTASAVPATAAVYSAIDMDLESAQWQQVNDLLERLGVPNALDEFRTSTLADAEGELTEEELNAFLGGEAGFYALPSAIESMFEQFEALNEEMAAEMAEMAEASPEAMEDMGVEDFPAVEITGVGAILEPSDPALAWDYIDRQVALQADGEDVQIEETTEGDVTILTITPSDEAETEIVVANTGALIIVGGNIIDVQTAIDTANGDAESLADLESFNQVVAELPAESISVTYYDNSQVMGALGSSFLEGIYSLSPELEATANAEFFGGVAVWADADGFRMDSVSIPAEGSDLSALVPDGVVTFTERVPAETTIYFGGIVPDGTWNTAAYSVAQGINVAMSGEQPEMQSPEEMFSEEAIQEQLDQAEQTLGFNLLDDFFAQFGGETAFALTFPNLMTMGSIAVDTVFVTELEDPAPVAESVEKLVRLVSSMAGDEMPVTTREIGDDTLYVIGDPATTGIPAIEFGVVENYLVLGSGAGVTGFLDGVASPLADDAQYQEVLGLLPGDNYYQVAYVDLTDIVPTLVGLSGMSGGASGIEDADPACLEFSTQDEAQAAYDEDPFANSNLDQDFDGQACEDFFAPATAVASPAAAPSGSIEALQAIASVAYESDGNLYSSAIVYVGDAEE